MILFDFNIFLNLKFSIFCILLLLFDEFIWQNNAAFSRMNQFKLEQIIISFHDDNLFETNLN